MSIQLTKRQRMAELQMNSPHAGASRWFSQISLLIVLVAQLDRASASEAEGCRFDPYRGYLKVDVALTPTKFHGQICSPGLGIAEIFRSRYSSRLFGLSPTYPVDENVVRKNRSWAALSSLARGQKLESLAHQSDICHWNAPGSMAFDGDVISRPACRSWIPLARKIDP